MRYLLDANCCIFLFTSAFPELNRRVHETPTGEIGLSAVTFAEVAHGSARGLAPSPEGLAILSAELPVVPFDAAAAQAYASLPFVRGNFDRLLAAHAVALGCTVITDNAKHFRNLPGVSAEDWTRA